MCYHVAKFSLVELEIVHGRNSACFIYNKCEQVVKQYL